MAVYDIKDAVSTCKHWKARVSACLSRWLHPNYGIRVSYFWSGNFYVRGVNIDII